MTLCPSCHGRKMLLNVKSGPSPCCACYGTGYQFSPSDFAKPLPLWVDIVAGSLFAILALALGAALYFWR